MWRMFFRWISPSLVTALLFLQGANAQTPTPSGPSGPVKTAPGLPAQPKTQPKPVDNTDRTPGVQYLFAFVSLLVVMLIVCKPSRKG
jgi:hypothetical protein